MSNWREMEAGQLYRCSQGSNGMVRQLSLWEAIQPDAKHIAVLVVTRAPFSITTSRLYTETGWAERTIRSRLNVLERLGLVARPYGPRKGWAGGPYAGALRLA